MADERRIVIELKVPNAENNESGTGVGDGEEGGTSLKSSLQKMLHPVRTLEGSIFGKNVLVMQAYDTAKRFIKEQVMYRTQKYFDLTENYTSQQNLSNAMTAISKVTGFGSAVLGGAITGASVGPVGAVIGAVVGGVAYAGNEALNLIHTYQDQNRMINMDKMQSTFVMTRMGLVDGGRGTDN